MVSQGGFWMHHPLNLLPPWPRLSQSVQAAITNMSQMEWLINNRNACFTILESGKFKIKVPVDLVLVRAKFLAQKWPLSQCNLMV